MYSACALAVLAFLSLFILFLCPPSQIITCLQPECLLSKGFLSALPVISFSCTFYFWVLLPIGVNSPVTPTQIICRSVFYSGFCFFLFSYNFIHLQLSHFPFKIHTVRTSREAVTSLNATQKRKPAELPKQSVMAKMGDKESHFAAQWDEISRL